MDIERAMDFIVENMAQFSARFSASIDESRQRQAALEALVVRLAQQQVELTNHVDRFQRDITAAVMALAEGQRRIQEAQRHGDERLNALIAVVDGMVRQKPKKNGKRRAGGS